MILVSSIENEIRKRFEALASEELRADYSLEDISALFGEDATANALFTGKRIIKCKCCGQPFITNYVGKECYCNRIYDGKRTCKEIGASVTRNRDPITKEMDIARRVHLRRRSKAGKTKDACQKYSEWMRFAQAKEKECREGRISIDEFKAAVGPAYKEDRENRRRGDRKNK